jgi:putative NADH-flavin reductase
MHDRGTIHIGELPAHRRRRGLKEEPMSEATKQLVGRLSFLKGVSHMKLTVFGATGSTGRCLLEQALESKHTIQALTRSPEKLAKYDARVTVVQGNVLDPAKVAEAVAGADVVLCAIGGDGFVRPGVTLSEGTRNIVQAMKQYKVSRIVAVSALGIGDSIKSAPLHLRLLLQLLKGYTNEKEKQELTLKESGLQWIVVRPSPNTDGPRTGRYLASTNKVMPYTSISHADIADFMLKQLSSDDFLCQTVALVGSKA